jgi:hypothetical protein
MLLAKSLPGIVLLLFLDHLGGLVGMVDLEDSFEFRHTFVRRLGAIEKFEPSKHPLPKPAGNFECRPGIVRTLIVIGPFPAERLVLYHGILSLSRARDAPFGINKTILSKPTLKTTGIY